MLLVNSVLQTGPSGHLHQWSNTTVKSGQMGERCEIVLCASGRMPVFNPRTGSDWDNVFASDHRTPGPSTAKETGSYSTKCRHNTNSLISCVVLKSQ